jgi:hypothetical protein
MSYWIEIATTRFADANSYQSVRVTSVLHPWLKWHLSRLIRREPYAQNPGGPNVAPKQIWAFALGLIVAAGVSWLVPTHPVYNPPAGKFLLAAIAFAAAIWAREASRWPSPAPRDAGQVGFVVSFDNRAISLACPDGSVDKAQFDEIERISIEPYDNAYLDWWIGPFFVVLHVPGHTLSIPACTVNLHAFLGRLLDLPGIDRDGLQALFGGGELASRVVWTREKSGPTLQ